MDLVACRTQARTERVATSPVKPAFDDFSPAPLRTGSVVRKKLSSRVEYFRPLHECCVSCMVKEYD